MNKKQIKLIHLFIGLLLFLVELRPHMYADVPNSCDTTLDCFGKDAFETANTLDEKTIEDKIAEYIVKFEAHDSSIKELLGKDVFDEKTIEDKIAEYIVKFEAHAPSIKELLGKDVFDEKIIEDKFTEDIVNFAVKDASIKELLVEDVFKTSKDKFNRLVKQGEFEEAKAYAKEMLDYWAASSTEMDQHEVADLLAIAARISSKNHYATFKNKYAQAKQGRFPMTDLDILNYNQYFDNIPLVTGGKDNSMVDFLLQRIYVNPSFLNTQKISIKKLEEIFRSILKEIMDDKLLFSIMHATVISLKEDPYAKIHLFGKDPVPQTREVGRYIPLLNALSIIYDSSYNPESHYRSIKDTLCHEWTHQLMTTLYGHFLKLPHTFLDAEDREKAYKMAYTQIEQKIETKYGGNIDRLANTIVRHGRINSGNKALDYTVQHVVLPVRLCNPLQWGTEYIVCLPQTISSGRYVNPEVHQLLQPLRAYWGQYIAPDIENYIAKNKHLDNFAL